MPFLREYLLGCPKDVRAPTVLENAPRTKDPAGECPCPSPPTFVAIRRQGPARRQVLSDPNVSEMASPDLVLKTGWHHSPARTARDRW
jgi:hypothetical protein